MVFTSTNNAFSESNSNASTIPKPSYFCQNSGKRRQSDDDDQAYLCDSFSKRECTTNNRLVQCPLAKFGCSSEVPYNKLLEHYSDQIHKEILMKAIETYVKELHIQPFIDESQCPLEQDQPSDMNDVLNIFEGSIAALHDDNIQIHRNYVELVKTIMEQQKQMEKLKLSVEEKLQWINALDINGKALQTEVESLKEFMSDSSELSLCNGTYIWRITDVSEKIANAKAEKQTSIYSAPFYSSPTGYKMCLRLYMNGDGQARDTHLSLFFVLMRSNYDPILTWPFSYKVTFCLYDQSGQGRHIMDSFRPDVKSNSFQRPRSSMNIASGIPKFLSLSVISSQDNAYVRDDCMFIGCTVDFESLPKTIFPFMANLNPGFPVSLRERLVRAEIQKNFGAGSTQPIS